MKRIFGLAKEKISLVTTGAHVRVQSLAHQHSSAFLFTSGCVLLVVGLASIAQAQTPPPGVDNAVIGVGVSFDDTYIKLAICQLFALVEGSYGALIMAVAGLGAIVNAAMGGYKAAMTCMVVACGSMILRPVVVLYFGSDAVSMCSTRGSFGKIPHG